MKGRFCHICGRVTNELFENKCRTCFVKERSFITVPEIQVRVCRECLRHYRRGRWEETAGSFEDVLMRVSEKALGESIKVEMDAPEVKIECSEPVMAKNRVYMVTCRISAKGGVSGIQVTEEAEASVKATLELCKGCSKRAGGYFEAILQMRGPRMLVTKGADTLYDVLTPSQKSHITNVKNLKEGTDLYFASTAVAKKSAKQIVERFGGTTKESAHLHTKDKSGHDLYRVTISLRLPEFVKNDVVSLEGRTYQVLTLGTSGASLFDLADRVKRPVPYRTLEKAERLEGETVGATVLEAIKGRLMVMESRNFTTLEFQIDAPQKAKDTVNIFMGKKNFLLALEAEYQ